MICVSLNFPLIHFYILDGKHSPRAAIKHSAAGACGAWGARAGPDPGDAPGTGAVLWEQLQPFPGLFQPCLSPVSAGTELCPGHHASSAQCPPPKASPCFGLFGAKHPGLLCFALLQPPCTPGLCFVPWCNSPALIFCISHP